MSMASWPAALPQWVLVDGFSYAPVSTVAQISTEAGEPLSRARFTGELMDIGAVIEVDLSLVSLFRDFWQVDLGRGALPFLKNDPIFGEARRVILTAPPKYVPLGGTRWQIIMALRFY
jgi:hypothetical protein